MQPMMRSAGMCRSIVPSGSSDCESTPLERARELLEEPPGHAVLDRDDDRVVVVQRVQPIGDIGDLVGLEREHHDVLGAERGQIVAGLHRGCHHHGTVRFDQREARASDRGEVSPRASTLTRSPASARRAPNSPPMAPGANDAHAHRRGRSHRRPARDAPGRRRRAGQRLRRGETLAAIRGTGLTLIEPDGSVVVAPAVGASDDLAAFGPQDVVVLSLKAHQIAAVADRLEALYDESTIVVPVQNGVPWWFFQKLTGPFQGRSTPVARPGRHHRAPHPGRPDHRRRRLPRGRAGGARRVIRLVEGDRFPVGELDGSRSERVAALAADARPRPASRHRILTDIRVSPLGEGLGQPGAATRSARSPVRPSPRSASCPATRQLAATDDGARRSRSPRSSGCACGSPIEQRIEGAETGRRPQDVDAAGRRSRPATSRSPR